MKIDNGMLNAWVFERISRRIITLLKKGIVPWANYWCTKEKGIPTNFVTREKYGGVNLMLLSNNKRDLNLYATKKQVESVGGILGPKARGYFFYDNGNSYEIVYHIKDCRQLPYQYHVHPYPPVKSYKLSLAGKVAAGSRNNPKLKCRYIDTKYDYVNDNIRIKKFKDFEYGEVYYYELFRELIRSTGHPKRLKRVDGYTIHNKDTMFYEELVCELGAAYLKNYTQLYLWMYADTFNIKKCITCIEADCMYIIRAAYDAQKAVEYILNKVT